MSHRLILLGWMASLPLLGIAAAVAAGEELPRVFAAGESNPDVRLGPPATLDGPHPFRAVAGASDWPARSAEIKFRVQVAAGLWPWPTPTELRPRVELIVDQGDYCVERACFESLPGHYVTGNLYRPSGAARDLAVRDGKRPVVLCPHGHWDAGRFHDAGERQALAEIAIGAERFENGARSPLQARCVQLARMGCIVFHYDMLGYADSRQFAEHRHGPRSDLNSSELGRWGFESAAAHARLQSWLGLQTYNSARAVDFVLTLPEADADRVLVTGASGGATQTMLLGAVDPRVDALFPCVMASTAMQGGCPCENACLLRIGQGNIDIAATAAPRPLGLTAADDWTVELESQGHPDLLQVYAWAGAADRYEAHFNTHFQHNYNHVSRTQMYQFVNRHFGIGLESPVLERDFERLDASALSVWTAAQPAPSGDAVGDAHERAVNRWWAEDADAQLAPLWSAADVARQARAREIAARGWETAIGRALPAADDVAWEVRSTRALPQGVLELGLMRHRGRGETLPAAVVWPTGERFTGSAALWIAPAGKASLFDAASGALAPAVARLAEQGVAVAAVDLFQQGEGASADAPPGNPPRGYAADSLSDAVAADSWQRSAVYYFGYNDALFARRVHDVLTAAATLRLAGGRTVVRLAAVGADGGGRWVACARAVAPDAFDWAAVDVRGFRFGAVDSPWDADFLPGAVRYGDLAGALAVAAPAPTYVWDDDASRAQRVRQAYVATGAAEAVAFAASAAEWQAELERWAQGPASAR